MKLPGRRLFRAVLACFVVLVCQPAAWANQCTLQVSPVVFPPYDPFSTSDTQATGTITLNCAQSVLVMILMRSGGAGSVGTRRMTQRGSVLRYNLYLDAAGSAVWGDGTDGSQFYSNPSPPHANVTAPVYGRIPARQTGVVAGPYSDTVSVTIVF